ncbi:MAG TPA: hypothetical protein VGR26_02355, partial [Acidimicrobiales bacterium]|nr:hypothetical protein [Acidimicrobiales bacterium]
MGFAVTGFDGPPYCRDRKRAAVLIRPTRLTAARHGADEGRCRTRADNPDGVVGLLTTERRVWVERMRRGHRPTMRGMVTGAAMNDTTVSGDGSRPGSAERAAAADRSRVRPASCGYDVRWSTGRKYMGSQDDKLNMPTHERAASLATSKASANRVKAEAATRTEGGQQHRLSIADAQALVETWPEAPKKAAEKILDEYGPPN